MFSANSSQVSDDKLFVEDVFSTYLYTGNGGAQTINNGIDLTGKGGLVWLKMRSPGSGWSATQSHALFDTVRGDDKYLSSDLTNGQYTFPNNGITFNSSGFGIDAASYFGGSGDQSTSNFASWTFRKAPKFFDVVTYTGDGVNGRLIPSSLATGPGTLGAIMVKRLDSASDWKVFHRRNGTPSINNLILNSTNAQQSSNNNTGFVYWENDGFLCYTGSTDISAVNASGATYVAYLFAHDPTSDGIIQCGSTDGVSTVNLGWEPQWVMIKKTNSTSNWTIIDTMRGWTAAPGDQQWIYPNLSNAEAGPVSNYGGLNSTGFSLNFTSGDTYVYIAIRRGPMRTPTLGTSVFSPSTSSASTNTQITTNFPVDMQFPTILGGVSTEMYVTTRLTGVPSTLTTAAFPYLNPRSTGTETTFGIVNNWNNTGFAVSSYYSGSSQLYWNFRRAPGFFDVVCYTGTGANRTINHNLGVAPELMIVKRRDSAAAWYVYATPIGTNAALFLNLTNAATSPAPTIWNDTAPTATVFTVGTGAPVNGSGGTFVNYLFASCPGVSKVGNYTGNGSSQTINCAFTTGARFVLIKRTDSTGDWYVWDSARGIVAGNDPYLALNTTAAEVTTNDSVDTDSSGFVVNQVAATNVNVNGATYIFLAIA